MRTLAWPLSFALACAGGPLFESHPAPPPTPAPELPRAPVEAEGASPRLPEGAPGLAAWIAEGNDCVFTAFEPGMNGVALARIEGECGYDWFLSVRPDQRKVLLTVRGSAVRAVEVDLEARTSERIDLAGIGADVEVIGYTASGEIVALAAMDAALVQDEEHETAEMVAGNDRFPIDPGSLYGAADYRLCGSFSLDKGRWKRTKTEAIAIGEGVAPPFCVTDGLPEIWITAPSYTGGHGEMGADPFFPEVAAGLDTFGKPDPYEFAPAFGPDLPYARTQMWLEGYSYAGPLLFRKDGKWSPVEGFGGQGTLSLMRFGEDQFLACTEGRSALVRMSDAAILWSVQSPLCATLWPPAAG